ncbi:anaerobic ribonucleoside-triphosphate reductase-activating protein [Paenibacillus sp. TCA20]|uniref:4Fe-4S cluster-binding domain-containing protein n=1 Tax=Paenibacillus urinalis TaxID=521520 RepID=A0ABY7XHG7_9BACL|nr:MULTISPECIES: 4Fe-4S cluster-binding domain-containing protein [Paenibacillus]WDI05223.1 4Fe-4S cluster-binding domain-containing protein [Paenibacillus urinalis]GAK41948.1 anaerobic ribonucleoside-triphosphate reductase-activating protein [Paenibacillus sp. TCA20]
MINSSYIRHLAGVHEVDMKRQEMRFIGVTKDATTAGPGKRLELFLKGCIRGIVNPCEGCFNPATWEFGGLRRDMKVDEVVYMLERDAWNLQITFCGGEPLLQTRNLIKVCTELKRRNPRFHIVVYTAYVLENLLKNGITYRIRNVDEEPVKETLLAYSEDWNDEQDRFTIATPDQIKELMSVIDLLVDGDYQAKHRIPTEKYMNEGMFVGSSNQRVFDTQATLKENSFIFLHADEWMEEHLRLKHCKCCGHGLEDQRRTFCDSTCSKLYRKRDKAMAKMGGA